MTAVSAPLRAIDAAVEQELHQAILRFHEGYSANDPAGNRARFLAVDAGLTRVFSLVTALREELADETTEHVRTQRRLEVLEARLRVETD